MQIANDTLLTGGAVDLSSNWTSPAMPLEHAIMLSLQLEFSGSPSGTFYLEASAEPFDLRKAGKVPTVWTLVEGSSQNVAEAGDHTWLIDTTGFAWIRVQWTSGGSAGSLDFAKVNAKGL